MSAGLSAGQDAPDPGRWTTLAVILAAAFMQTTDVTIVNVAIPSIQRDLHTTYAAIQLFDALSDQDCSGIDSCKRSSDCGICKKQAERARPASSRIEDVNSAHPPVGLST